MKKGISAWFIPARQGVGTGVHGNLGTRFRASSGLPSGGAPVELTQTNREGGLFGVC
jgi:nitrate/nitrite transporter NarK